MRPRHARFKKFRLKVLFRSGLELWGDFKVLAAKHDVPASHLLNAAIINILNGEIPVSKLIETVENYDET
jgi:hypothetical protein